MTSSKEFTWYFCWRKVIVHLYINYSFLATRKEESRLFVFPIVKFAFHVARKKSLESLILSLQSEIPRTICSCKDSKIGKSFKPLWRHFIGSAILDSIIFFKGQEITELNAKSR